MDLENPPKLEHGIPDPETFLPGIPDWIWWVYGGGVLLFLLLIWASLKLALQSDKNRPAPSTRDFLQSTRKRIRDLESHCHEKPLSEVAAQASLAIRSYLAGSFSEPALYETTEEFQARQGKLPHQVNEFLNELSDAKYAKSTIDAEKAAQFLSRSEDCLERLAKMEAQENVKLQAAVNSVEADFRGSIANTSGFIIPAGLLVAFSGFLRTGFHLDGADLRIHESLFFWIGLSISLVALITYLVTKKLLRTA